MTNISKFRIKVLNLAARRNYKKAKGKKILKKKENTYEKNSPTFLHLNVVSSFDFL